jgi:hypothetical protein
MLTVDALLLVRNTFNSMTNADNALSQFAIITGAAASGALMGVPNLGDSYLVICGAGFRRLVRWGSCSCWCYE